MVVDARWRNLISRVTMLVVGLALLWLAYALFKGLVGADQALQDFGGNRPRTRQEGGGLSGLALIPAMGGGVLLLLSVLPRSAWKQVFHTFSR